MKQMPKKCKRTLQEEGGGEAGTGEGEDDMLDLDGGRRTTATAPAGTRRRSALEMGTDGTTEAVLSYYNNSSARFCNFKKIQNDLLPYIRWLGFNDEFN